MIFGFNQTHAPGASRLGPLLVLFLVLALADARSAQSDHPGRAMSVRQAMLQLAQARDPSLNVRRVRAQLDVFELELRDRLATCKTPDARVRAFVKYFFEERLFTSDEDLTNPSNFYLDQVLESRQGFCLSLSALMVAVARRVELPVSVVAAPRHVFLRWVEGDFRRNIETTEGGRARDDDFYLARGITAKAREDGVYLAPLDAVGVIAQLLNNEGHILWHAGRVEEARVRFAEAVELLPRFPEALANLGVIAGERGEDEKANAYFERARVWTALDAPMIVHNQALVALRSGRFAEAAQRFEQATLGDDADARALASYRHLLRTTVLRKDNWDRYQASIHADGERLRESGVLARGFLGQYFASARFEKPAFTRVDREIEFEWRWSPPGRGLDTDDFSVRWDGYVDIPRPGRYTFFLVFEQGTRLWVDGIRFVDFWNGKSDKIAQESLNLESGLHPVRVEYAARRRPNGMIFTVKDSAADRALPAAAFWHRP